ncbi:MAG: hydrogenase maturation protease [Candidatus Omnitrophica bacterium]|nr:hydrogenase maturation protease [Candidatus Omnitrophota bacterium]
MKKHKKILVVGIGSILRSDDGVGVEAIEILEKEKLPENVSLLGADVSGMNLLKYFPGHEKIIIIDAAEMGEKAGTVKVFGLNEIEKARFNDKFSTHGMALLETLTLGAKLGMRNDITIIGVEPENTGFGLELSSTIKSRIPQIVEKVKELINLK